MGMSGARWAQKAQKALNYQPQIPWLTEGLNRPGIEVSPRISRMDADEVGITRAHPRHSRRDWGKSLA
jgi:hypothetical protein